MPHKDPAARAAYQKARWLRLKNADPVEIAARQKKHTEYMAKRLREDAAFAERKKASYKKWYDAHGKEEARKRKGYVSWEEYEAANAEKRISQNEYMRRYGQTLAGKRSLVARAAKRRCGSTIEEYDATYARQNGACKICKVQKPQYGKGRLVIDHCHKSGKFRALLCGPCNSAIGLLGENVERLHQAIAYLQGLEQEENA